jgi:hypothetical protein
MSRSTLLVALLAAYVAAFLPGAVRTFGGASFDPLQPRPRAVEELIVAKRFADALPLAKELRGAFPNEPLPAYWLARINAGLQKPRAEADAWDAYVALSQAPADACPAWPRALARANLPERAAAATERCAALLTP